MRLSYAPPTTDEETLALAGQIVKMLVAGGVTYQKADEALTAAQEMLMKETRPTMVTASPHSSDRAETP